MTVIARAVLFAEKMQESERLAMAECALCAWLGAKREKDDPMIDKVNRILREQYGITGRLENWLPTYCNQVIFKENAEALKSELQEKMCQQTDEVKHRAEELTEYLENALSKVIGEEELLVDALKKLSDALLLYESFFKNLQTYTPAKKSALLLPEIIKKRKTFGFRMFTKSVNAREAERNTFNLLTYEKILADALDEGKLREEYLACKCNWRDGLINTTKDKMLTEADEDFLLKSVVLFLRNQIGGQDYAKIEQVDLSNWSLNKGKASDVSEYLRNRFFVANYGLLFEISWNNQESRICLTKKYSEETLQENLLKYFLFSKAEIEDKKNIISMPKGIGFFYLADSKAWKTSIGRIKASTGANEQPWQFLQKAICFYLYHEKKSFSLDYPMSGKKSRPLNGFRPEEWFFVADKKKLYMVEAADQRKNYTKISITSEVRNRFELIMKDQCNEKVANGYIVYEENEKCELHPR